MVQDEGGRLSAVPPRVPDGIRETAAAPGLSVRSTTAEIVDLLAAVPGLREAAARAILVDYIGEAVGAPLLLPELPDPRFHLYHLVVACREVPDGLRLLVEGVEWVAGQTMAAARLRRLVSPAREHLEPTDETLLEEVLVGLRIPALTRLVYAATDSGIGGVPHRLTDAWDAFTVLLDHNAAPDRPSPHLIFIAMLVRTMRAWESAGNASPQDAWRTKWLREWLGRQTERLRSRGERSQADYLDRIRDRSGAWEPRADRPIYLIMEIEPIVETVDGRVPCRLSHWRQVDPMEWRPEPGEDQIVPLQEVPAEVGRLIREAESGWAYQLDDSLVLEFILPEGMLDLALEEWTRDPPDTPHPAPLGAEYEILIRSQERLRAPELHRAWRQRWQLLVEAVACETYWAPEEPSGHLRAMGDHLLSSRDVVACVLSGPADHEPGRSELRLALRAGIPVVLWHRAEQPPQQIRDRVRQVMAGDLRALPGEVKQLRANLPRAADESPPSDLQVALLWDDPNHFLGEADTLHSPAP